MKKTIRIVEVGLRDGLQNESEILSTQDKLSLADHLIDAGIQSLEIGAFVRADRVPQMADTGLLLRKIEETWTAKKKKQVHLSALVPNERGMTDALEYHLSEVAIFTGASESFTKKNINASIEESFRMFEPVVRLARKNKIKVRGYLSTCFVCPYEGEIDPKRVVQLTKRLLEIGCYEVSIGDTIGVATPKQVKDVFQKLSTDLPLKKLAGHFHDTRGGALANILQSWQMGLSTFDSSIGGLGGCPYAPGSSGNVATEDVVHLFHGMGVSTGLNFSKLLATHQWLQTKMKKPLPSKAGRAPAFSFSKNIR